MRLSYWDRKNGSVRAVKRMAAEFRRMRAARDAGDDLLCATTRDRLTAGYVDSLRLARAARLLAEVRARRLRVRGIRLEVGHNLPHGRRCFVKVRV
jgi:hypothetical protein